MCACVSFFFVKDQLALWSYVWVLYFIPSICVWFCGSTVVIFISTTPQYNLKLGQADASCGTLSLWCCFGYIGPLCFQIRF